MSAFEQFLDEYCTPCEEELVRRGAAADVVPLAVKAGGKDDRLQRHQYLLVDKMFEPLGVRHTLYNQLLPAFAECITEARGAAAALTDEQRLALPPLRDSSTAATGACSEAVPVPMDHEPLTLRELAALSHSASFTKSVSDLEQVLAGLRRTIETLGSYMESCGSPEEGVPPPAAP